YQKFGPQTAAVLVAENIGVKDGFLNIEVKKKINNPSLAGIVMYKQSQESDTARLNIPVAELMRLQKLESGVERAVGKIITETQLYPNPAKDRFNLELQSEQAGEWEFVLVNSFGASFFLDRQSLEVGPHLLEFDISDLQLSAGIYYLTLRSNKNVPVIKKLIIK